MYSLIERYIARNYILHACMDIYVWTCIHTCSSAHIHLSIHAHIHACLHPSIHPTHIHIRVCLPIHLYIYIIDSCMSAYIHTCTHIHIFMCDILKHLTPYPNHSMTTICLLTMSITLEHLPITSLLNLTKHIKVLCLIYMDIYTYATKNIWTLTRFRLWTWAIGTSNHFS